MSWWDKASDEQRLAQIDGGIECQMSRGQVATNLGTTFKSIRNFCIKNGRDFSKSSNAGNHKIYHTLSIVNARRKGAPNTAMRDAFNIFDHQEPKQTFLDQRTY